ncbi:hypothetical protein BCF55_1567 [Hydrogenivirga caldilitoris]|uniref:Polymerase/histidinol phosphatase N-terminal domain-containing protein n=1 Tax=Hydrogenivirga caldilitoris TaxID=246264 RepID=A0A497XQU6_9AQUI|nr:PHP domain-containing protein [Hydrogenivirga caldilitoris]RLJ71268.1 hypothetical protein BCF55_1567 [Hydrogenivirga caldilitoris]
MIEIVLLVLALFMGLSLWFFAFPVRFVKDVSPNAPLMEPPDVFVYSYVLHIHTQFSYDSLGKPEDVIRAREEAGIDYVIVTDHGNDHIKNFADDKLIAGKEIKLNDDKGNLQGDLLEIGDLKVIAHHFRGKYRWKLEKTRDYLFELVDLRDALLENKLKLILYLFIGFLLYPILGRRIISNYTKLINTELYVERYFKEGWLCKVVGGLDHHVKLYLREVKKRLMVPSYELSFSVMRNFVTSRTPIESGKDLLKSIKEGINLISFSSKPSFVWIEENSINVYSPFNNTYVVLISRYGDKRESIGSNAKFSHLEGGFYIVLGYTYALKVGRLLFGVKPLFVSDLLEVC